MDEKVISWLLDGDVSVQYQVNRDLLNSEQPVLRQRIAREGWGAKFLSYRKENGHWGRGFYQPKWISTHYTILDLKNLGITPENMDIRETIGLILRDHRESDGGVNPGKTIKNSDVCINGMFLNYTCYFEVPVESIESIVDFLISLQMGDGGFNCKLNREGAVHSSLHSTISVLEGLHEYSVNGYRYRLPELIRIESEAREFILQHKLFRSDRTNEVIDKRMLMLSYPSRWRYDILRALDYFQSAGIGYDARIQDGVDVLMKKRRKDGTWPLQAKHPGQTHLDMEQTGKPSRWNTLRALRVLKKYSPEVFPLG